MSSSDSISKSLLGSSAPKFVASYPAPKIAAMRKSIHTPEYHGLRAELCRIRKEAGFSQRKLAKRLRAAPSLVANIETGERRIDLIEFIWFVHACEGDPVEVLKALMGKIGESRPHRRR